MIPRRRVSGILVLLGLNIFGAMMKRHPWKAHHTGAWARTIAFFARHLKA